MEKEKRMVLDMTKGRPVSLIVRFMVPLLFGNVFQQLYNMVDTIIVGRYIGVSALAAVGATGTIVFLIFGFVMGLTSGFTVLTAQRFGAGDIEGMKSSVGSAVILAAIVTFIITIISVSSMDLLLRVMNTPEDILAMSKDYIVVICLGLFCCVLYNLASGILRALGNSRVPLYSLIVAVVINVFLDMLLIVVIPLGVAGAAIATVVSQAIAGIVCVVYIIKKMPLLQLEKRHWKLNQHCAGNQLKIGVPMALQFSVTAVGTILVQTAINLFGSVMVAAFTAGNKITQLVTQPFGAMGITIATFAAQNRGLGDIKRIRQGVRISCILSTVYAVVIFAVVLLIFPYIIRLFVEPVEYNLIIDYARISVIYCGICYAALGAIFIFRNAMQGCGHSLLPSIGGVVEMVVRVSAAYVAIKMMSYRAVFVADGITWVITAVYLGICYLYVFKKHYSADQVSYQSAAGSAVFQTEARQESSWEDNLGG